MRTNLRRDGRVYLNYDSGHFVADVDLVERAKALASHALARLGSESRYRRRVTGTEASELVERSGLRVVDDKVFNTDVKRLLPLVGPESREGFMEIPTTPIEREGCPTRPSRRSRGTAPFCESQ